MARLVVILLLVLAVVAAPSLGQAPVEPAAAPPDDDATAWALRLGRSVVQVQRAVPTVDRVVLVPDSATYLDELGKWSPRGRWPVLIEDDTFAPLFVRSFRPAAIVRRVSVRAERAPLDAAARRGAMEALVIRAWGGDPATESSRDVFARLDHVPSGVVITSAGDPAWTAAAALAAGRGVPLAWLDESYGRPGSVLAAARAAALRAQVEALVAVTGYPYEGLGRGIDTITLCRALPGSMNVDLPPDARVRPEATGRAEPRATTDVLGRDGSFDRFAFTGWIFGDETRCAYVAMCALFTPRARAWLVHTYAPNATSDLYDASAAAPVLRGVGFEVESIGPDQATLADWRRRVARPLAADIVFVNTKGNVDFFDLASGRARTTDVPVLDAPAAIQFIHSWSMRLPDDAGTIGAAWLDHGASAYIGSVHEPFLGAFVPPALVSRRIAAGVPLLVAARWWPGETPFARPWKVSTYGDPLMLCAGPGRADPLRIAAPDDGTVTLSEEIADLMRRCESDETGTAFALAVRSLVLLGRDEVAVQLWQAARQRGVGGPSARAVLGALFRDGRVEEFIAAWDALPSRDAMATDMLWLLLFPRVAEGGRAGGGGGDGGALERLEAAVRPAQAAADVEVLRPHLERRYGSSRVRALIERELQRATSPRVKRGLTKLRSRS